MSDDSMPGAEPAATVKKPTGWPRGKPRGKRPTKEEVKQAADRAAQRAVPPKNPLLAKMKSRPNWESEDFIGVDQDNVDRLRIPPQIIDSLWRDGIALQWVTKSVRGQETPQELSKMTKGGWTPVHQSDFDGVLDGMFMPKGVDEQIIVEDCLLVARPTELQKKARAAEGREARRPLQVVDEQLGHGIPGVTGSGHPTALRGNMINRTIERIEIPE
jgi:hypothetical protein